MSAEIVSENDDGLVIQVTIPRGENFLDSEEEIKKHVSMVGRVATQRRLEEFDTDGSPVIFGPHKLTAKRKKVSKKYETPYGTVAINRFVYQSPQGGATYVPLDHGAKIIGHSTPRFAKLISFKYSHNNAGVVMQDIDLSLGRKTSRCFVQNLATLVAEGIENKKPDWDCPEILPDRKDVEVISIGLDGTCLYYKDEGYREAMVGTISFHDGAGDRLQTIYVAASPEYGKTIFLARMDQEIERIKAIYGKDQVEGVRYAGISDGAAGYESWLKKHTSFQILDFWHLTEYLADASKAMASTIEGQRAWLEVKCHQIKHDFGAAKIVLSELSEMREKVESGERKLNESVIKDLEKTTTYMSNHIGRMNYASYRRKHLPIGSGITEAGCKTVVKQRMCGSCKRRMKTGTEIGSD